MVLDKFEAGGGENILESGHHQEFQTQSVTCNSYYASGQEQYVTISHVCDYRWGLDWYEGGP
jgi:hypothetical protein